MTFGGGFGKIFSSSFWEMAIIAVLAAVPSSALSYLTVRLICSAQGYAFSASFGAYILSFLFSLAASAVALLIPCKAVSRRTPVANITAEDNSNYVKSPRRSFEFFKVSIPLKYELTSVFRFRRYFAGFIVSGLAFSLVFAACAFTSELYLRSLGGGLPDLVITYSEPAEDSADEAEENGEEPEPDDAPADIWFTDEADRAVSETEGVNAVHRVFSLYADEINAYVAADPRDVGSSVDTVDDGQGREAFNCAVFSPCSERELSYLCGFDLTGDPKSAFTGGKTVIVCDTLYNSRSFSFKPGDRITVAAFSVQRRYVDPTLTGTDLLKRELKAYEFSYTEYTVGAVIHDMPDDGYMRVFIPEDDYKKTFGIDEIRCRTVEIWLDGDVSESRADSIEAGISDKVCTAPGVRVVNSYASRDRNAELSKNKYSVLWISAVTALSAVPLMWLFSSRMFDYKRRPEFRMLEYIGVGRKKIARILLLDHAAAGAAAAVLYLISAPLLCSLLRLVANRFFSGGGRIAYTVSCGPALIMTGAAVLLISAAACFVNSYISYLKNNPIKDRININTDFGDE